MIRLAAFLPISLLVGNLACDAGPPKQDPAQVALSKPNDHFEIRGLTLEERDGDLPLWHARAEKARGGLQSTQVTQVVMKHYARGKKQPIVLQAPRGTISPTTHNVELVQAVIENLEGQKVEAKQMRYDRDEGTVVGTGPILIHGPGFHLKGSRLRYDLETGHLLLEGPIEGTCDLSAFNDDTHRP